MELLKNIDWRFVVFFVGDGMERRKCTAKSKIKGYGNTVIQNSSVHKNCR